MLLKVFTEQPPLWVDRYVGIDFSDLGRDSERSLDCWGLVRLVMKDRAGIELPPYSTVSEDDYRAVSEEIGSAKSGGCWTSIPHGEEEQLDVVEMVSPARQDKRVSFLPIHVGIVVSPGWVLHTEAATGSRLSSYREQRFSSRVIGFWRHRSLAT